MAGTTQVVSTIFRAKDRISKVFSRMNKKSKKFGKASEKAFKRASKAARAFKGVTASILKAQVISKGFQFLASGISEAVTQFISFDDAIVASSAKFKDLNLQTAEGQKRLQALKDTARETGAQTQFSATEAAQGLDFLALSGVSSVQAMALLPGVVDLATAANVDLARSTDIATDSLGAFGLMTEDTEQLQKNFERQNNVMAKTMTSTNTSLEDIFEAVKKGAADFTAGGQSIESFNTLLGVMANNGIKGSEAGTKLRNVMTRLAKPTKEAQGTLDDLGVTTQDSKGNFRDIVDIVADFEVGLKGMGTAQRAAALATVFGTRQTGAMNKILAAGSKNLTKFRKGLLNTGPALKNMANLMRKSLGNRIKALQSAALELGFKFLDAFKGDGVDAIEALTTAVREFKMQPIIDGVKTTVSIFKTLGSVLGTTLTFLSPLIAGFVAYKAVVGAYAVIQNIMLVKTHALTAAQWLYNIALNANPIGLIVAGVAALGTAIYLVVKNWEAVKSGFMTGLTTVVQLFEKIFGFYGKLAGAGFRTVLGAIGVTLNDDQKEKDKRRLTENFGNDTPMIFEPPNKTEAEAQSVSFKGLLEFKNAPAGATFQGNTFGAPEIQTSGLGQNRND